MGSPKGGPSFNPDGRPTKYNGKHTDELVFKLSLLGLIDRQMADVIGITESTFNDWKHKHPSFSESIKNGKDSADAQVAKSLYQRANGYSHTDEKIFCHEGEVIRVPIIKHHPPDTTAMIFWLKNRQPELFRDKRELQHSGDFQIHYDKQDADL